MPAAKPVNWDDVRVFLAIARAGQMLAAARRLGMDHATVGRHLTALEASLGTRLVDRRTKGCMLTQAGERLLIVAERVESELLYAQSELVYHGLSVSGTVTLNVPESLSFYFLSAELDGLLKRYPDLSLKLISSQHKLSLSKREADIAITTERPVEGRLTIRKLLDFKSKLFAAKKFIEAAGAPPRRRDLSDIVLVTTSRDAKRGALLGTVADDLSDIARRNLECSSLMGQVKAIKDGVGVGILPRFIARQEPDLVPIVDEVEFDDSFWIVTHLDVRKIRRINEVHRFILASIKANSAVLY